MTTSVLATLARKDRIIGDRVAAARLSRASLRFIFYLYWRNRFPILLKVISRVLILIEFALLFYYFNSATAASLSFTLFIFFILVSAFQGTIQSARLDLIVQNGVGTDSRVTLGSYSLILILGSWLALGTTAIILKAWLFDSTELFFIALGFILVPITLLEHLLWNAVYTKRRLRRSLAIVVAARVTPIISLILFHELLGPFAYGVGVLIGRVIESSYLIFVARRALKSAGREPIFNGLTVTAIPRYLTRRSFWEYVGVTFPFQVYLIALGALLLARGHTFWTTYFLFIQLLALVLYLSLRPSYSLGMDLYLSAESRRVRTALRFKRTAIYFTWVILAIVTVLTVGIVAIIPTYLAFLARDLLFLLPWFVLITFAQTLHLANYSFHRILGSDREYLWSLILIFVFLGIPLQWYVLLELRGNLPFVLAIDFILNGIAAIALARINIKSSPITKDRAKGSRVVGIDEATEIYHAAFQNRQSMSLLFVAMLGKHTAGQSIHLVNSMLLGGHRAVYALQISTGLYCLIVPQEKSAEVVKYIKGRFGGHIAAAELYTPLSMGTGSSLENGLQRLKSSRSISKSLRELVRRIERGRSSGVLSVLNELKPTASSSEIVLKLFEWLKITERSLVVIEENEERFEGVEANDLEFMRFVERELAHHDNPETIVRPGYGPYVVFAILGRCKVIVDMTRFSDTQRELVRDAAVLFALRQSIRALLN